ncbi:MAG: T9SS type A sorting domain-containing protein [bacterium]|nr:T9SS type A sorting domain-containing protein [bacterium]
MIKTSLVIIVALCYYSFGLTHILNVPSEFPTIQQAIDAAVNYDTILIQPLNYYEQLSIINKQVTLSGIHLFSNDSVHIDSTVVLLPDSVVNGGTLYRSILYIRHSNVKIHGLTFKNGYGRPILINTNPNIFRIMGGGICADSSIVKIEWCKFKRCYANGGGIGTFYSTVEISNCRIDSCIANTHTNRDGGGLYSIGSDTIKVINSIFSNNQASFMGGGMFSTDFNGELSNCLFINNSCPTGNGGGATLLSRGVRGGFMKITNNSFYNNIAGGSVALYLQTSQDTSTTWFFKNNIIMNNRVTPNIVTESGGVTLVGWNNLRWEITDNLFFNNGYINTSSLNGGGLVIQSGIVNIKRNLFIENIARYGSAISIRNGVTAYLDSNFFSSNQGESLLRFNTSHLNATNNDFIQNQGSSILGLSFTATMVNNYWGHPTGPRTASNPGGQGDSLPDQIPYIPFRTTPVFPELEVNESEMGNNRYLPTSIRIDAVYPNPFNSKLTVEYFLQYPQPIKLALYEINGREVQCIHFQWQPPGKHSFKLDVSNQGSGVYLLLLTGNNAKVSQKVLLLK